MTGIEGYRLVRRIGAGGMGTVHEALDADGRRVAIKVLHESISEDPAARRRLRREVELLHRVKDDRVARVLDAEVDGVDAFIVTELVEGPTLEEHVRTAGPLTGESLARLAGGLADGLDAIHAAGITHRDLKPGNVMLAEAGPVIIDFGIAQVADDVRLTQTGMITGTPGYLDPDVIAGADPGPDGDWWAWAAVLAFAATGRPPFGRGTIPTVLARVSTGVVDTEGLPEVLARALRAALEPEPRRRLGPTDLLAVIDGDWDLEALTDVLATRPPASATRAVEAPAFPPSYAPAGGAAGVAATRGLPAGGPQHRTPAAMGGVTYPDDGGAAGPWAGHPDDGGPWPWDGAPQGGRLAGHEGYQLGPYSHVPPPPTPSWAVAPGRTTVTVGFLGLGLSGLATMWPGAWAVILAVVLVLCGAVGRGSQSLRAARMRRGLRRGDSARAWLAAPWHLLWALVASLPGLLIGAIIGGATWWAAQALTNPVDSEGPLGPALLWGTALIATLLAWTVPPSDAAREGARRVLGALPRQLRIALALLVLAVVGALVAAVVLGNVDAPSWSPFPVPPVP